MLTIRVAGVEMYNNSSQEFVMADRVDVAEGFSPEEVH